jgi:protein O-mannosyl-transferase
VIGYFPVSNVLIPSGIVLAERTLFLPSVGIVLVAGLLAAAWPTSRAMRGIGVAVVFGLVAAGVARSASRHTVWRDQAVLIRQTLIDAPLAYRPHRSMAKMLFNVDEVALGERYYREALRLYPPLHVAGWELADEYRKRGLCEPALPLYREALEIQPNQPGARAAYLACLAWLGDHAAAREQATAGMAYGTRRELFAGWRIEVGTAEAAGIGPGVLRLTAPPTDPEERRAVW